VAEVPIDSLLDLGLALGLGGLVGIERERHRKERMMLAGIRTYPLVALSGLLAAYLADAYAAGLLISIGAATIGGFSLLMYWVRQEHGTYGLTSPIALFATYFIGVLVGTGFRFEAVAVGLAIALLLFTKERLHHLADVLTPQEMEGALYFLVLAFILYPVVPEEPVDPWGLFSLRYFLLIILLVSAISFVSFLAVRRYGGELGLPFSGFLGGLVNSEATTASLAQLHRARRSFANPILRAILLTCATMFVRNLVIAGIADPRLSLLRPMLPAMLAAFAVYFVWAFLVPRGPPVRGASRLQLRSPFAFRPAIIFAFWFSAVSVATVLLQQSPVLGERAVYAAALGGIVSAGAVVASMGALVASGGLNAGTAAEVAVLASLLSAANKIVIARLGGPGLPGAVLGPTVAAVTAGGALLLAL
jgi:uncharacterized membrane protein (DUF4010 family)